MAIRFKDTISINEEYTFPLEDGTADQILATDGAGNISFVDVAGGEAVKIECKNTSGSTITKGTPVYVTGTVGTSFRVEVAPADASDSAKMPAVGLLETDLANNGEGYIVTGGLLKNLTTDPIDGTTPSSNDTIYVKAGGGLTMTKPTGSNLIQNIGKVGRVSSANSGSVVVSSILRTNDVPNLTEGKIWVGSANNTIESTVVHIDETNSRVGIGTNSPTVKLEINPSSGDADLILSSNGTQTLRLDQNSIRTTTTNDLTLFTNGNTNQLVLDSGGNIGIGTNTPASLMHLSSTGSTGANLILQSTHTSGIPLLDLKGAASSQIRYVDETGTIQTRIDMLDSGEIRFVNASGAVERVRIDSSGSVISGYGATLGNYQFTGSAYKIEGGSGLGDMRFTAPRFRFYDGVGNPTINIASGNVGINETNPSVELVVSSASNAQILIKSVSTTGNSQLWFGDGDSDTSGNIIYRHNGNSMAFETSGAERLRIDSSGRVGIGTTNPAQANLVISPTAQAADLDGLVLAYNPDGASNRVRAQLYIDNFNGVLDLKSGSDVLTTRISSAGNSYFNNGNLGVGTNSPSATLHTNVTGNNTVFKFTRDTGTNGSLDLDFDGANSNFNSLYDYTFQTAGTERLRINSSGNVIATVDMRAPIFYDSDDTTYYINPAGTSVQSFINIYSPTPHLAIEDSNNGAGGGAQGIITFRNTQGKAIGIGYTANETSNSDLIISTNAASTYGGYLGLDAGAILDTQADIILDPKTEIRAYGTIDMNNNNVNYVNQLHFNDNVRFYDNGDDSYLNFKYGDAAVGAIKFINGSAATTGYLYASTSGFGLLPPDGTWGVQVTNSYTLINHETRSPIFYDSDNTAYYLDPNGASSRLNYLYIGEAAYSTSADYVGLKTEHMSGANDYMIISGKTDGNTYVSAKDGSDVYIRGGGNLSSNQIRVSDGSAITITTSNLDISGTLSVSNNTGAYIAGAAGNYGTYRCEGVLGSSGTWAGWAIRDDWVFMSNGSAVAGIYNDTNNEWSVYCEQNARTILYYNGTAQVETQNGYLLAPNQMRSPIFYDSNNTAYYGDFASLSNLNQVNMNGRSSMMYAVSDLNSVSGNVGVTGFKSNFGASNMPGSGNYATGVEFTYHDSNARTQLAAASSGSNNTGELWVRSEAWGASSWSSWWKLWHQGNDGASSGLDADLLDGWQTISGGNYWGGIPIVGTDGVMEIGRYIDFHQTDASTNDYAIRMDATTARLVISGGYTESAESMRAPLFYDSNDTTYYVNPAGDSYNLGLSRALAEVAGWVVSYGGYNENYAQWIETEDATQLYGYGDTSVGMVHRARRVKSGQTVRFTITLKSSVAVTSGLYLRLQVYNGNLPDGKTHVSNAATASSPFVQEDSTQVTGWYENGALGTSWQTEYFEYTATADCYISLLVLNWTGSGTARFYVKTPDIQTVASPAGTYTNLYYASDTNYGLVGNDGYFDTVDSGLTTDPLELVYSRGTEVRIGSGGGTKPIKASVFYEGANTAYYLDPAASGDSIRVAGDVVAYYSSDERLKNNIIKIDSALDKVNAIGGYTFEWNEISHKETGEKDVGVIAQEVEEIFPEIVQTRSNGYKAVNYEKLVPLLIEAVKELSEKVKMLENK